MRATRIFEIERPARKSGGDRYQEVPIAGEPVIMKAVYILQAFSRSSGSIAEKITITLTDGKE
jgi:hypothetical protein